MRENASGPLRASFELLSQLLKRGLFRGLYTIIGFRVWGSGSKSRKWEGMFVANLAV